MPRFSVIVPVYNVEAYLRECLDSILSQGVDDIEIIAVNDASTDNSGHILDEYDAREEHLRVIHLEQNAGLGPARNVGLDAATGEYVLFVDSDDWLAPGSLRAIQNRLMATDADVLIFDYARSFWNGKERRNAKAELFERGTPDVFALDALPELLNLLMVVWNKAYRRTFLEDLSMRFRDGYYEDLPWTYPVLLSAQRMTLLNRVCYLYRQRRHGNILRTSSRRHFDAFKQYQRIFAFLDEHPELDRWRPVMHQRMVQHLLTIIRKGDERVPNELRREYFTEAARLYRHYRPAQDLVPPLQAAVLRVNAYPAFQVLEFAEKVVNRLRRIGRRGKRKTLRVARTRGRRVLAKVQALAYAVARLAPIDQNLAVFAAYWYSSVACNPGAIYAKLRELKPEIKGVWVLEADSTHVVPDGIDYVVADSWEYFQLLARAKYFVNNVNFPNEYVKRPGQIHLQTQHGTPLKTMGLDLRNYPIPAATLNFNKLLKRSDRWDFNLSSNRHSTEIWGRVFPCGYEMLEYGYPRNDMLVNASPQDRQRIRAELDISDDKTVILYAPTFRDYEQEFEAHLDLAAMCAVLDDSYVVLTRAHYFYDEQPNLRALEETGILRNVSALPDIQPLCLAADILITDYSSVMFDFANLGRPIIIFADDWEIYRRLRGVYFDLLEEPPGAVATTQEELHEILRSKSYAKDEAMENLERFAARFCEFDDGRAAERVVRRVFMGQKAGSGEQFVPLHDELSLGEGGGMDPDGDAEDGESLEPMRASESVVRD